MEFVFGKGGMSVRNCLNVVGNGGNERVGGAFSCSENDEIMCRNDEMVLGNGVIVLGSEGIRFGKGGMVW